MICKVINTSKQELEQNTNKWLNENNGIEIINILQSESSDNGYITLTIFYLNLKESRLKKINKINNT